MKGAKVTKIANSNIYFTHLFIYLSLYLPIGSTELIWLNIYWLLCHALGSGSGIADLVGVNALIGPQPSFDLKIQKIFQSFPECTRIFTFEMALFFERYPFNYQSLNWGKLKATLNLFFLSSSSQPLTFLSYYKTSAGTPLPRDKRNIATSLRLVKEFAHYGIIFYCCKVILYCQDGFSCLTVDELVDQCLDFVSQW